MKIQPGWEQRLRRYLATASHWRFDLVRANCAHFSVGVIEALTAVPASDVIAASGATLPETDIGVRRVLAERGGMRGLATAVFGQAPREDVLTARFGDVAVLDGNDGETLGVVEGGGVLCVADDVGLVRVSLSEAKGYWSVR